MDTQQFLKLNDARFKDMRSIFNGFLPVYRDIRDFLGPYTARFQGEKRHADVRQDLNIINTSPRSAVRALQAGMQSGVTSPIRPWFRLGTPDPALEDFLPVKEWLHEVEKLMRQVLSRSNIYDRLQSNYGILGMYGTSCIFIEEDAEDVVRARDLAMGTFMISDDYAGRVDALYRESQLSTVQMIDKFGIDRVPSDVKTAYDNGNYEQTFQVRHSVEKNPNWKPNSLKVQDKKFISLWRYCGGERQKDILKIGGFSDIPFFAPRWNVWGEDVYGEGCGHYALGDSRQVQLMEKRNLQIIDKIANPPMIADSSMRNERTSILPGSTTYVNGLINGRPGFTPAYQIGNAPLQALESKSQQVMQRIDEAFYKNLFLMVAEIGDQPNITATQINTMREEKLMMLGPVLERLNNELLDPLIDRVFNVMFKRGMFPPPPEELAGQKLRIEYISVLAQAQKALGIGNIERFVGFVGNVAGMKPEALDRIDIDEVIEEYAEGVAIPPQLVTSREQAMQERQARAEQQQRAEQMQAINLNSDTARNLSQTDVGGESALTRAVEVVGGTI